MCGGLALPVYFTKLFKPRANTIFFVILSPVPLGDSAPLCSGPPKSSPIFLTFTPRAYTCVIFHLPTCFRKQWICKLVKDFIKDRQLVRIFSVLKVNHEPHHQSQMRALLFKLYPHGTYEKRCFSLIWGLHVSGGSSFLIRLAFIKQLVSTVTL